MSIITQLIGRVGFGQVEPNHLSMQRTGQMQAQWPIDPEITQLENGEFLVYNVKNGRLERPKASEANDDPILEEYYMVFNEVKLYGDTYNETYKDYAMRKENFTDGEMVPRVIKLNIGDIYTTNCLGGPGTYRKLNNSNNIVVSVGDILTPSTDPETAGFLKKVEKNQESKTNYQLLVTKIYTMPDGQMAVKLIRAK